MIVTCPDCETRYAVDDTALGGAAGRRVRCANCGKVWHHYPEAAAVHEAVAEAMAEAEVAAPRDAAPVAPPPPPPPTPPLSIEALRDEPRFETQPHPLGPTAQPRPSLDTAMPAAARRRRARVGGLGLVMLTLVILIVAIGARDRIMRMWPSATPVYRSLGLADPVGAGLEVTVTPARTADSLLINGKVVNTATTARTVPRLRIALRDGNNTELDARVIDPPVESLAPGATADFNTVFKHPSITATGVAVTFASR